MVQLACSIPNLTYAIDSHYHDQTDDIITKPWVYRDGRFDLPEGSGLGVELDRDKLDFYHRFFLDNVEVNEFYDPYRPGWVPALPIF
jgi:glucarate dehydratase